MCWPSCKGAAYLAVSVFIYRALLVVITMTSSAITGQKSMYVGLLSVVEEWLLQLVYFIPLFTTSSFILIGIESKAFSYVLYSTLSLGLTLCIRYSLELAYIYSLQYPSHRNKLPPLFLNLTLDLLFLFTLLIYARTRLRHKNTSDPWSDAQGIYRQEEPLIDNKRIHNDLVDGVKNGVGAVKSGKSAGETPHYPSILPIDPERAHRPLPSLPPPDEMDDLSLPPPVPLALPDSYSDNASLSTLTNYTFN